MNEELIKQKIDEMIVEINTIRFINPHKTLELIKEALAMSEDIDYEFGKAILTLRLGGAYGNLGKYEEAVEYTLNSLDLFVKEEYYDLLAAAYVLLGMIFTELADYERSVDFYNAAERIAQQIDSHKKYDKNVSGKLVTAVVLNNIAEIYTMLKDFDEAIVTYEKSISISQNLNDHPVKGLSLMNLARMQYIKGRHDEALSLVNRALEYMKIHDYKLNQWEAYEVLALINWKLGCDEKVDEYFKYAIDYTNEELSPYSQVEVLMRHHEYLKDKGKMEAALEQLKKAYSIALDNSVIEKISETSSLLAELFEEMNNNEEAFKYYKLYRKHEIEYNNSRAKQRISSFNARKRLDEIETEKKLFEENNKELKRRSDKLEDVIKNISIISELGQKLTSTLNLETLVNILYKGMQDFMDITTFGIYLYNEIERAITPLKYIGDNKSITAPAISVDNKNSITAKCILSKEIIVINDMDEELSSIVESTNKLITLGDGPTLESAIFCPLIVSDYVIGVMTIHNKQKNAFTAYHLQMTKALSAYASIAVNNAIKSMKLEQEVEYRSKAQFQLELANKRLLYFSENDGLTGIANRRSFDNYMNALWDSAAENKNKIALIICDIDSFKEYNDNYGHVEGDRCIVEIANVLVSSVGKNNFVARYGGDEFVVVLPGCKLEEAIDFGETLRRKVEALNLVHKFSKISDRVTITLGASAIVPQKEDTINDFIRKSDTALYEAKKRGRNQITGLEHP